MWFWVLFLYGRWLTIFVVFVVVVFFCVLSTEKYTSEERRLNAINRPFRPVELLLLVLYTYIGKLAEFVFVFAISESYNPLQISNRWLIIFFVQFWPKIGLFKYLNNLNNSIRNDLLSILFIVCYNTCRCVRTIITESWLHYYWRYTQKYFVYYELKYITALFDECGRWEQWRNWILEICSFGFSFIYVLLLCIIRLVIVFDINVVCFCFCRILQPGGIWVNLGPLLYHYSDIPNEGSIEPTYEDLLLIIRATGFQVLVREKSLLIFGHVWNEIIVQIKNSKIQKKTKTSNLLF